jgi:serine/threonine protein kinase
MTGGNEGGSSLARVRESSFPRALLNAVVDDRYRIVELIGAGAMGTVYRAEHLKLGTSFALKVLRPELADDARMVERFARESRAAASVVSEHVVPIVDSGILPDGLPYFVMQLLPGSDLRALLQAQGGRLTPARAANVAIDACRGLAAAHAVGLVHRDLKPANLFVTRGDDGRDVVKILDFGVAKHLDSNTTRPGALIGTARYMAPEQIGLEVPVGPATDLFALGVILYECIAGDVPFAGDTAERVLYKTMTAEPVPLSERCPGLPSGLSEIVAQALQKEPGRRFASALAMADALLPYAGPRRAAEAFDAEVPADSERGAGSDTTISEDGQTRLERSSAKSTPFAASRAGRMSVVAATIAGGVLGAGALELYRSITLESDDSAPETAGAPQRTQITSVAPGSQPVLAPTGVAAPVPSPAPSAERTPTPASPSSRLLRKPQIVTPPPSAATRAAPAAMNPAFDPQNPYAD